MVNDDWIDMMIYSWKTQRRECANNLLPCRYLINVLLLPYKLILSGILILFFAIVVKILGLKDYFCVYLMFGYI